MPDMSKFFKDNDTVLVMTVTSFFVGKKHYLSDADALVLSDVFWVGCTGYFKDFLKSGKPDSCDPYPSRKLVYIASQSIVNAQEFKEWAGGETNPKKLKKVKK